MAIKPRRVAVMLDLQWLYKRHAAIFVGTQQYAEEQGWDLIIDEFVYDPNPARRGKLASYDGVIARANRPLLMWAGTNKVPVVNVWPSSLVHHLLPSVFHDFTLTGRIIAEHLLARGLHSFATLTSGKNVADNLELKEMTRLFSEAGFTCNSRLIPQNPWESLNHWRKTEHIIESWMDEWKLPIGVYVNGESEGRMIVEACRRRGWSVPADVSIIAGKNEEVLCEHPRPSLTSIEIGYDRIGYEAARLLDSLINGEAPPMNPILLPPQGLVVRESTDFFAVDNTLVAAALAYISANSHRPIGPDNVAEAVGAEVRTLQNYFRKVLGRPVATEIRRVRIERAKRELTQSKRLLYEIAQSVGFGEEKRLYEIFKREVGVSPGEYRKQRQVEG